MYTNVDSLYNKLGELKTLLKDKNYDIVALTEIFPKSQVIDYNDSIWNIPGYTLYHPSQKIFTARGCVIYTKETIQAFEIDSFDFEYIEHIQIGIHTLESNILISCIYRSPNATNEKCIDELSGLLSMTHFKSIKFDCRLYMGDFNCKEINWQNMTTSVGTDHISTKFLESVMDTYLFQHVHQPTRYRGDNHPSLLDLIFTNEDGMINMVDHCAPLGNSDHEVLEFKVVYRNVNNVHNDEKMCYFKGDYDAINSRLNNVEWEDLLSEGSIDDYWDRFADELSMSCAENIPVRKPKHKNYDTPWMNEDTLSAVQNKRKMWKKYKYCKNEINKQRYEQAKTYSNMKVREAQEKYEKDIVTKVKDDPKVFWRYVQSKTKVKENIQCIIDENGELYTDNENKAELLNKFFHSVFTHEQDVNNLPPFNQRTNSKLEDVSFTEELVKKHLSKVKETKSQGSDSIHPKLIKETVETITKPVTKIFTKSMECHQLPSQWKLANITPIHKKGSRQEVSNYRPISLTSIICKTMERIVRDKIMAYMEVNNFFSKHQHGFRKGRSCTTQLIEVIENWTESIDNQNSIDAIYLDFQKAFDTVPHQRLISKLKGYGISGNLIKWLENFLQNRKQRVVLNGSHSTWTPVTSGIPQGSVLGPILFTIYINDLPDVVDNMVKLFADDTKLYANVNSEDDRDSLQNDMDKLIEWSDIWLLKFNKSKCKHIHIGQETGMKYNMAEENITTSDCEKDLGVLIDNKLNFQDHINTQVKKANQKLGIINRTFSHLDKDMFLTLYKSLVRPHLEYCSTVWSVINKKEAIKIENVQRRATRLLKNIQHRSYGERLVSLGLPTLQYRRLRADLVETYKIINKLDQVDSADTIFPIRDTVTRGHKFKIFKKHNRTNIRKQSFTQRVVDHWNSLPDKVVEAKTLNSFKSALNAHWKNYSIKFVPDFYGPEAGIRDINTIEMDQRG